MITPRWSVAKAESGREAVLYLDGRPILTLQSAGSGHIVDTSDEIAQALNERDFARSMAHHKETA